MPWNQEEEWEKVRRLRFSAEECRAAAAGTKVEEGRRNLLDVASTYDALADRTEARLKGDPSSGTSRRDAVIAPLTMSPFEHSVRAQESR
jgi:hypothetical protein